METLATNYISVSDEFINEQTAENIDPIILLTQFARSHEQIISDEKKTPVLTDTNPWLEYYFHNTPERTPVSPKGDSREEFLKRIIGCDPACQPEILKGWNPDTD